MGETKTDKIFAKSPHHSRQHLVGIPSAISSGLWIGESDYVPRSDHYHRGLEHIKAEGYPPIYGGANIQAGSGMAISQAASGIWIHNSGGAGADEKIKVSSDDTTADYLINKLVDGSGTQIALTEVDGGGNETLKASVDKTNLFLSGLGERSHESLTGITEDQHHPKTHDHTESDITDLDHDDTDAIHDNVGGEINAIAEKGTPIGADILIIEDSASSNVKKKVQVGNLPTAAGADEKVKVTSNDTTTGYLANKLIGGSGTQITLTEINDGGDEDFKVALDKSNVFLSGLGERSHESLTGIVADQHHNEDHAWRHQGGGPDELNLVHTDDDAIHDNVMNEINQITTKVVGNGDDVFIIEDSAASWNKKKMLLSSILSHSHTESQISDLDHDDTDAIHDNVAGEIVAVTEKATLVANDEFLVEDSVAANVKKSAKVSAIRITESQISDLDHDDTDAIHDNVSGEINGISEKTTPVGADLLIIEDSASSNAKKKVQITNLPSGGGGADVKSGYATNGSHTFSTAFTDTPEVTATVAKNEDTSTVGYAVHIKTRSTTGFTYEIRKIDEFESEKIAITDVTNTETIGWIATDAGDP